MKHRFAPGLVVVALLTTAISASGQTPAASDGTTIYKEVCAACHDAGFERAPGRDALRGMTPERILAALESGAMISMMAARREHLHCALFVTPVPLVFRGIQPRGPRRGRGGEGEGRLDLRM